MFSIPLAIAIFLAATSLGVMEISSEGSRGGARNFPSWRLSPDSELGKIIFRIMPSDFITSYHLSLVLLLFILFHFLFLVKGGVIWSLAGEFELISFFLLFVATEDVLWFVWNKYYGIRRLQPQFATWHKVWIDPLPAIFTLWLIGSLSCSIIASILGGFNFLLNWGVALGIFLGLTLLSIFISELIITREDLPVEKEQT